MGRSKTATQRRRAARASGTGERSDAGPPPQPSNGSSSPLPEGGFTAQRVDWLTPWLLTWIAGVAWSLKIAVDGYQQDRSELHLIAALFFSGFAGALLFLVVPKKSLTAYGTRLVSANSFFLREKQGLDAADIVSPDIRRRMVHGESSSSVVFDLDAKLTSGKSVCVWNAR